MFFKKKGLAALKDRCQADQKKLARLKKERDELLEQALQAEDENTDAGPILERLDQNSRDEELVRKSLDLVKAAVETALAEKLDAELAELPGQVEQIGQTAKELEGEMDRSLRRVHSILGALGGHYAGARFIVADLIWPGGGAPKNIDFDDDLAAFISMRQRVGSMRNIDRRAELRHRVARFFDGMGGAR